MPVLKVVEFINIHNYRPMQFIVRNITTYSAREFFLKYRMPRLVRFMSSVVLRSLTVGILADGEHPAVPELL